MPVTNSALPSPSTLPYSRSSGETVQCSIAELCGAYFSVCQSELVWRNGQHVSLFSKTVWPSQHYAWFMPHPIKIYIEHLLPAKPGFSVCCILTVYCYGCYF